MYQVVKFVTVLCFPAFLPSWGRLRRIVTLRTFPTHEQILLSRSPRIRLHTKTRLLNRVSRLPQFRYPVSYTLHHPLLTTSYNILMYFLEDLSYQLMNPGRYVVELDPKETIPALLIFKPTEVEIDF